MHSRGGPARTLTPSPEKEPRVTESHRRATSSPGAAAVLGLAPLGEPADPGADDRPLPLAMQPLSGDRPSTPEPGSGVSDPASPPRSPRSFPLQRKVRVASSSPHPPPGFPLVAALIAVALLLALALVVRTVHPPFGTALGEVRSHLLFSFRGAPPRPRRFSVKVKCGPDAPASGPIASSEGCVVIAPSCSETWVAVLDAGEERVLDGICRDDSVGVALMSQRCEGSCRTMKQEKPEKDDGWQQVHKEFVIESIGAKGSTVGSLYDPRTNAKLPESASVTVFSFPEKKIALAPAPSPKGKGKKKAPPPPPANATLLRFPVLGLNAVAGEQIPAQRLLRKNVTGWMEQLWAVGGFRHLFEGICDLRSSELGCGGQNDGVVFPHRRWHVSLYAVQGSGSEQGAHLLLEDVAGYVDWRWILLGAAVLAMAALAVALRPCFEKKSPGRLAKLKSMTFLEHDIARVAAEAKLLANR
ncbi:hypothetical protein DFJ74DRAFT_140429 [Hyaloraphidium curvatum]|nr:hypothetical protein DFJ74DRAFT_140429 [Hyaloraphidium curvatum]